MNHPYVKDMTKIMIKKRNGNYIPIVPDTINSYIIP